MAAHGFSSVIFFHALVIFFLPAFALTMGVWHVRRPLFGLRGAVDHPKAPRKASGDELVKHRVVRRDEVVEGDRHVVFNIIQVDDHTVGETSLPFV